MIHPSSNTNEYSMLVNPQSMQTRHLLWFHIQNIVESIKDFLACPGLLDHLHSKAVLSKDDTSSNEVQFVLKCCANMSQKYLYSTFFETKHWLDSRILECFALSIRS